MQPTPSLVCLLVAWTAAAGVAQGGEASPGVRLVPSVARVSTERGGQQRLWLDAGVQRAGRPFVVLGSASGTSPGLRVGAARLPLNVDAYFWLSLGGQNPMLLGARGSLDAAGRATARVDVPARIARLLRPYTLHHGAVVFGAERVLPSNAASLRFGRTQARPNCGGVTFSITGPMQHAAGTNTCGWIDRTATGVCPNTRATLAWLTQHFGGQCFVDPNQVYESSFALHEGASRKDPPFFAQFFPTAFDRDGNSVKYRLRLIGDIAQGSWPTPANGTTVFEFPSFALFKDTGKGKSVCLQKSAVAFSNGAKVVVTLTR